MESREKRCCTVPRPVLYRYLAVYYYIPVPGMYSMYSMVLSGMYGGMVGTVCTYYYTGGTMLHIPTYIYVEFYSYSR